MTIQNAVVYCEFLPMNNWAIIFDRSYNRDKKKFKITKFKQVYKDLTPQKQ